MILFYLYFPIITNHWETITVPDLKGLNYDEIDDYLTQRNLKYEIIPDSSFTTDYPPLSVIFQNPIEGKKVKEGRKIYLTLNSIKPPKIKMPKLALLREESRGAHTREDFPWFINSGKWCIEIKITSFSSL